uniref:hypothetical protein n=1 Tax=Mycobacterium sp. TaxID=1785 RepID=UPI003F969D00
LGGNHVYPTASPAACFAGAGRLIAHVVHHIQIVSEGFPLPTSRMHANPTGNIYILQLRGSLSMRPNCGVPSPDFIVQIREGQQLLPGTQNEHDGVTFEEHEQPVVGVHADAMVFTLTAGRLMSCSW